MDCKKVDIATKIKVIWGEKLKVRRICDVGVETNAFLFYFDEGL